MKTNEILTESTEHRYKALLYQQQLLRDKLNDVPYDSPEYNKLIGSLDNIEQRLQTYPSKNLRKSAFEWLDYLASEINLSKTFKIKWNIVNDIHFRIIFEYGKRGDEHRDVCLMLVKDIYNFAHDNNFVTNDHIIGEFHEFCLDHGVKG